MTNEKMESRLLAAVLNTMLIVRSELTKSKRTALTVAQFRLLSKLAKTNAKASDLARGQNISLPAMSNLVAGLVKRGWVERIPSKEDRRIIELKLTPRGRDLIEKTHVAVEKRLSKQLDLLSDPERQHLARGLIALEKLTSLPKDRL